MRKRARITLSPETDTEPEAEPRATPRATAKPKPKPKPKPKRKPRAKAKRTAKTATPEETEAEEQPGFVGVSEIPETPPPGQWQTRTSPPPNREAESGFTAEQVQPGMLGSLIRTPAFGTAVKVAAAGLAVLSLVMLWRNRRF